MSEIILEMVLHLTWDMIFKGLCFHVGRWFLSTVTFGRHPSEDYCKEKPEMVSLVGFIVCLIAVVWVVTAVV